VICHWGSRFTLPLRTPVGYVSYPQSVRFLSPPPVACENENDALVSVPPANAPYSFLSNVPTFFGSQPCACGRSGLSSARWPRPLMMPQALLPSCHRPLAAGFRHERPAGLSFFLFGSPAGNRRDQIRPLVSERSCRQSFLIFDVLLELTVFSLSLRHRIFPTLLWGMTAPGPKIGPASAADSREKLFRLFSRTRPWWIEPFLTGHALCMHSVIASSSAPSPCFRPMALVFVKLSEHCRNGRRSTPWRLLVP